VIHSNSVTLRGGAATLVWGYHTVADLRAWRIVKGAQGWHLSATWTSVNPYRARKTPLYFTAPHDKGHWCFPVIGELVISGPSLTAPLGPPEQ
jgi:hypothetical protein